MPIRYTLPEVREMVLNNACPKETDVFIAGSGPIACTFARKIIEGHPTARVCMVEIGSQEHPIPGHHQKNSVKYQRDVDAFVNVVKGALQPVSIPPTETFQSNLGSFGWNAPKVITGEFNPDQKPELNLRGTGITRTFGGMATHWTCSCPTPHKEEREKCPIEYNEFEDLLEEAGQILNVHENEFDGSIRHREVKKFLQGKFPDRNIQNIPLAVERGANREFVTWTGADTVLGDAINSDRLTIRMETRVTAVVGGNDPRRVGAALIREVRTDNDDVVAAKVFIIACGAICTPQILWKSNIRPDALGRYLSEQSMAFCQVVLSNKIIEDIRKNPDYAEEVKKHEEKHKYDPLPIPFKDPHVQLMIGYNEEYKYHVQIHRDAFSYGEGGPRADPRVILDFRFFGKHDLAWENRVTFPVGVGEINSKAGILDAYGMPQPTFEVKRSTGDGERDQEMMKDMTEIALSVGPFLPGSYPQFLEHGKALHITGTTRAGQDPKESVVDENSRVHTFENLWVGGNGVIPDSTASNPTRTSIAYALKAVKDVIKVLDQCPRA